MKTEWWLYGKHYDEDVDLTTTVFIRSFSTIEEVDQFLQNYQSTLFYDHFTEKMETKVY
jgi:hypothetical protein